MGDMGDIWKDVNEHRKQKKSDNISSSIEELSNRGVNFKTTDGIHYIIEGINSLIDYWPSTGLFINRTTHKKGRGIFNLLRCLGK